MKVHPVVRALAVTLLATAYAALAMWVAGTGATGLLPPLSRAMTIVVALATGLIFSCAAAKPSGVIVVFTAWLPLSLAGAVAVTTAWLPLAWFAFSGVALACASVAGGIAGVLTANQRLRAGVAFIVALAPPLVVRYEAAVPTAVTPVTIASSALVHAPVIEAWQEVIGEEGPLAVGRATEWDDAEHLKVDAFPRSKIVPRGMAAWRAGWGKSAVSSTGGTYDLAASGDSATTLSITRSYRMTAHASAYPASWLHDVATARDGAGRAALVARGEARVQSVEPWLTVEMRVLRAAAIAGLRDVFARRGEIAGTAVLFINGARAVEEPEEIPAPEPRNESRAIATLRAALRPAADRARTTAWMYPAFGAHDDATAPLGDSLRMEFEDFEGRCIAEVSPIGFARGNSAVEVGTPRRARCVQGVMAERTRRSRLLAQLPLSAGRLEDSWSIALAVTGRVQVYLDSVVMRADTLRLKAKPLDGAAQAVDSIAAGLSLGGQGSWSIVKRGVAMRLDTTFAAQQEWTRTRLRFSVPIDSQFPLARSWPSFEVILRVPKTADNPYGVAWTYAHAPMAYFNGVRYP